MIYEKLEGFHVDVEELRNTYNYMRSVFKMDYAYDDYFGGWSIQSWNGKFTDGWERKPVTYLDKNGEEKVDFEKSMAVDTRSVDQCNVRTELCFGQTDEILNKLEGLGLHPRRARYSRLSPQSILPYHRDCDESMYQVRLHIPIITNPDCVFISEEGEAHMPADGSGYLVKVNELHSSANRSDDYRTHIIINVWDTRGVTKFNKYTPKLDK